MARVLLYERVVDAICINADLTCDGKTQNGVKIKEEIEEDPIDTTLNINTTENMLVKNCFNLIGSKSSPSENNISQKNNNINNKENKLIANSHSAYSNDVNKIINLKRKIVDATEELVHDASSQSKKKRRSFNQISEDGNTSNAKCKSMSYGTTIDRFSEKRKLQEKKVVKKKKKFTHIECDVCFRKFYSIFAYDQHKLYYNSITVFKCGFCKRQYKTHNKLHVHIMTSHDEIVHNKSSSSYYLCDFCGRRFNEKSLLQSHLFHIHNELIYSSNRVKQLNFGSKIHVNTSQGSTTLKTKHEEQRSNNSVKSEELNTKLKNNDLIKTKESKTEESSSHKMSSTKRLRQPTIQEYLELCKKKCDKHSPNKLNIKNGSPTFALHRDRQVEESLNPRLTKDVKTEFLSTNSSNIPKKRTHFTLEQNEKDDVSLTKKPFVKIHADVEMMKAFLDGLPDTVAKDNMNNDDTNKSILSYRDLPYSLRSPRVIPFIQTNLHLRSKSKDVSKSQSNTKRNTETEQNVTDLDFWETSMIRFKCRDCIIPLIRCDENPKNNQISTNSATFKTNASFTVQHNSTSFEENNIQNKTLLKELEVSLERLAVFPAVTKAEAILDVKKPNSDCFLCKVCNKSFSSKLDKQMHIKSYHVAYMSSICNARYKRKRKLCEHYLQEHSMFKLNQCCICYIILSNYTALEQHLNVHCIKYIQRKNDQYPVDKNIKCSKNKEVNKLHYKDSHCKEFSLSTSTSHESHCAVQEEAEEDQNNLLKETSTSENLKFSDIILKEHHNKNADKISKEQKVAESEKTHSVLYENPNDDSTEKSNKHQMSVIGENSVVANDLLVTEGIGTANESQNSEKLSKNSTINGKDIVNAQLDVKSDTKIELCIICGKQFHNHMKLQYHMRNFGNITDICPICGTGFSSKRFLRTHITAAHVPQFSKSYTFHCMFCNQGFFKKVELRSHVLHLHGQKMLDNLKHSQSNQEESDKLNITTCKVCYLVYETHDRYTEHMMYYYKNHIFTCSLCKQTFQGMYLFHNHYKLTHYSEDIRKSYSYTCEICNEGFKHESHFYSHKMHVHLNEEASTEIAKGFKKRNQLDHTPEIRLQRPDIFLQLQKQIEQSFDEYTCQICQMRCATVNFLTIHQAIYSNDGHFQCNNCNRRCRTSALLEEHIKLTHTCRDIYHGHVCNICGEVLETTLSLKCHEKHFHPNHADAYISNSQLSSDSYDCLYCDKNFSSASAVTMHIIQVHINKLLAKYPVSKPSSVDNIQEQYNQQPEASSSENSQSQLLQQSVKIQNLWLRYLAMEKKKKTTIKSSNKVKAILPESSNKSKAISSELLNQANTISSELSNQVKTVSSEPSNQGNSVLLEPLSQRKSVLPEPSNQRKSVLPKPSNQVNTVPFEPLIQGKIVLLESSNQVKTVITEPSNQAKTILSKPSHQVNIVKPSNNNEIIQQKVLCHASPHINGSEVQINTTMTTASSKTITPVSLPTRSINSLLDTSSNSGSANVFQTNQTSSLNESSNKSMTLPSSSNGLKVVIVPPNLKTNKTVDKKLEKINNYTCPLCAVEYPSLLFFHAHLRYAHVESICKNPVNAQVYLANQKISIIKCLLCPNIFTDEVTYKTHLKNFHTHYMYMPCFEKEKINNANNPIAQTNDNRKTIIPEVITLDDDNDIENNSDKHTAEADAIPTTRPCEEQNNKIGKLRVKSFAKIIENLPMDLALKPK